MVHPAVNYVTGRRCVVLQTYDGLIDLFHAVPAAYRQLGAWMMNSTTVGAVRNWSVRPAIRCGLTCWRLATQATIFGRPVIEAIDMPDIAANAFPVVFGNFNQAYRIYDRVSLTLLRDPFTQATNGLVRFHARRRVGGDVVKAEAIRKLKISVS